MDADFSIARFFCLAGGALLIVGLVLWWVLPIHLAAPPYLGTALLALAYGVLCWKRSRRVDLPPASDGTKEPRE